MWSACRWVSTMASIDVQCRVPLQGRQRSGAEVDQQPEVVRLHQVGRAWRVRSRKAPRAAQHGQPHRAAPRSLPAGAAATGARVAGTARPRKRWASRANGSWSPVARNRCSGGVWSVAQQAPLGEHPVDLLGGLVRTGHQRDALAHHQADEPGEHRVVRAAEHEGVHFGPLQRLEVRLGQAEQRPAGGHAALDELGELRAGRAGDLDVRGGGERVGVRAAGDRRGRADHADPAVAGGGRGAAHGRADHLDHRDAVPLAGIVQAGRRGAVAGDHEDLHPVGDHPVQAPQRVAPDIGDGLWPVREVRGVPDVAHLTRPAAGPGWRAPRSNPPTPESKIPIGVSITDGAYAGQPPGKDRSWREMSPT